MDKLKEMFRAQALLQKETGNEVLPADRPDLVRIYALGLFTELGEVLQADKRWKPWREDATQDKEETKKELADCMAFLINLCLAFDVSYEEFMEAYYEKHKEVCHRNGLIALMYKEEWGYED